MDEDTNFCPVCQEATMDTSIEHASSCFSQHAGPVDEQQGRPRPTKHVNEVGE